MNNFREATSSPFCLLLFVDFFSLLAEEKSSLHAVTMIHLEDQGESDMVKVVRIL